MIWGPSVCMCVPKGEPTAEAVYQLHQGSPKELLEGSWALGVDWDVCLHACLCVCVQWSVSAPGVGLWPWGLVCPSTSSWRDWDPQTDWLILAVEGIQQVHMHVYT